MTGLLAACFSLYLARVGAFVAVLPQWGGVSLPKLVKVGLTLALTCFWFGSGIGRIPASAWVGHTGHISWVAFGVATAQESILGALMGYAFGLFLVPAHIAGEFLTQEMGLAFAGMVGGSTPGGTSPLTAILEVVAGMVFLGSDGHHVLFGVLDSTFRSIPVGGNLPGLPMQNLIAAAAVTEEWGLMLAAPVALCLFLTTVILALLARAAPQLSLYTIGFPLRLGVGLAASFVLFPNFLAAMVNVLARVGDVVTRLV
jgi:flagellar biosynthesis protein FliR